MSKKKKQPKPTRNSIFSTDARATYSRSKNVRNAFDSAIKRTAEQDVHASGAMDSIDIKSAFRYNNAGGVPDNQLNWYGSQSFIGHQMCAILAQNWLIQKACSVPAKDAIRKGYDITINNGEDVDAAKIDEIKKLNKKYKLDQNLVEFVKMGRVFGIRIAMFKVESTDPQYYEKPFNVDGVKKGSYKGISQIDPYWCAPILESAHTSDPSAINFYEPEYWLIGKQKIHKSHLVIMRTDEVPDILKPTYLYGGIPLPQKMYERVYAAERTANEAPQLVTTKRTNVYKTDIVAAMGNQAQTEDKLFQWAYYRDNYGVKMVDKQDEDMAQFDTALGDLDAVIMTQYQLVASIANVPSTKLLGTSPKGFNATGEYEEANYREELESIQTNDMQPLIQRHHELLDKSHFDGKLNIEAAFRPLDSLTEAEQIDINLKKSQIDQVLQGIGAIDGYDVRNRIIADKNSGYNGLEAYEEENNPIEETTEVGGSVQAENA